MTLLCTFREFIIMKIKNIMCLHRAKQPSWLTEEIIKRKQRWRRKFKVRVT